MSQLNKVYDTEVDLTTDNSSHTLAIRRFLEFAAGEQKNVLEVGCATGYFGEQLCLRGHRVTGVEPSQPAAEAARARLSSVENCSIEQYLAGCAPRFDCIVFGDVLEHLAEPQFVLEQSKRLLEPSGIIIACLPNVAHLSVRLMLLEGRWEYGDLGLLDNTHLRFFTRDTVLTLFQNCGLRVRTMDRIYAPVDHGLIPINPTLQEQVGAFVHDDEQLTFQFLVAADRTDGVRNHVAAKQQPIRVLALMPSIDWTVGEIRIRRPLLEWQSRFDGIVRFATTESCSPEDVAWSDIVVVQRIADPSMQLRIQKFRTMGKRVVFELDDLLTEVPLFLETGHYYEVVRPYLEDILRAVDQVVVSTLALAERLGAYNANVDVIPNLVSEALFQACHNDSDPIHLIVASSDTVRVDFILPALREVTRRNEDTRIVAIGPPADALAAAGLDPIRSDHLSYPEFGRYISGWSNPIGVIPLEDSVFSSCKSPIKYLDYSNHGIPVIASNVEPYADVIEHGVTGMLVVNDTIAWVDAIETLITQSKKRAAIALEARSNVRKNFDLTRSAELWNRVISQVLDFNAESNVANTIALLNRQIQVGEAGRISKWLEVNFGTGVVNEITAFHATPNAHWRPEDVDAVRYLEEGGELAFIAEDGLVSSQGFATFDAQHNIAALRHRDGQVLATFFLSDGGEWFELAEVTRTAYRVAHINEELQGLSKRTRISEVLADRYPDIDLASLHAKAAFPSPAGWATEHLNLVKYLRGNVAQVAIANANGTMRPCSFAGFDPAADIMTIADDEGVIHGVFFRAKDGTFVELGELGRVDKSASWLYSRVFRPRSYLLLLRLLVRSGPRGVASYLREKGVLR